MLYRYHQGSSVQQREVTIQHTWIGKEQGACTDHIAVRVAECDQVLDLTRIGPLPVACPREAKEGDKRREQVKDGHCEFEPQVGFALQA